MTRYAEKTSVSVEKSRAEIEKLLQKLETASSKTWSYMNW